MGFQVLIEYGESRRIANIGMDDKNVESVIKRAKAAFGFSDKNNILLQEYDEDWETWLDLQDVSHLRDRQKLRLVLSQGTEQVCTY